MAQPQKHPDGLRKVVIALFFLGLLLLALLAVGIGLACSAWISFGPGWLNHVGGPSLSLGGIALVVWSVHAQYTSGKGTPAPKVATQKLVTNGPYAFTRNPMTLGALLLYLGIGVWVGSGVVILLTVIVFSGLLTFIYLHETQELSERFGEEYQQYRKRTAFLLPCSRRRRK